MKVFTATNGILFTITEDGVLLWEGCYDPRRVTDALREYFQRERDTQLGRWRDPENPDMVCYPVVGDLDAVLVMYEGDMTRYYATRSTWKDVTPHYVSEAAGRYFQAHPEPEPRPWEEAKPGEVWVLTRWGTAETFLVTGSEFITADLAVIVDLDDDSITAGRRIWPEPRIGGAE